MDNRKMNFTEELIRKMRGSNSPEEIVALAKENGVDIPEAQAEEYFKMLSPVNGEIADEELDNVSGGCETVTVDGTRYVLVEEYTVCFTGNYTQSSNYSGYDGKCKNCSYFSTTTGHHYNEIVYYCGYYKIK